MTLHWHPFFIGLLLFTTGIVEAEPNAVPLPEFTQQDSAAWINSKPLSVQDLRGKVALVDIWTFDCWNCYRSFPWLNAMTERLQNEPFVVVGVHSPEFEHEKNPAAVKRKADEFGLHHAIMLDNDFAYWRSLGNKYWPTYYLVDKQGRIRHRHVGETHAGDARAIRIEAQIRALLEEE